MSEDREEAVKPDRIGSMDPEVTKWKPPSDKTKRTGMRVFTIEQWIERERRFVEEEEIIIYAMRRWDVKRETARKYLKVVVEEFNKAGVRVLGQ